VLAENGIVGKNAEEMVPKNYRKTVYFEPKGSEVEVIVQVANFVQRKGGLWEPIRFGTAEQIVAEREKNVEFQMFIMSSLIAMGVYHLAFYFFRLKNKALLAYGLVCMAIALRTAVLGETILVRFFTDLSWEFVVKIEYWTSALG